MLNNLGRQEPAPINKVQACIDYGTSYVQTVTFDAKGPVAQAIPTYGPVHRPASPRQRPVREFLNQALARLPLPPRRRGEGAGGRSTRLVRP